MKICRYDDDRLGVVIGDKVHDVTTAQSEIRASAPFAMMGDAVVAALPAWRARLEKMASAAPGRRLEPTLRRNKEQRFSLDFSRIQVRSDTTAEQAARSASFSTQTKFGSESRGTLIHRADSDGKRGGTAPPANAPSAPSKVPQSATAPVDPIMASGSIDIKAKPLTLEQQGGQILAFTMGFKIAKPFTVKASAQVQEPPDAEPFEYGIVQNVFFDHIEEAYSDGDMLVDSVGPLVDCNSGEQPFIHANAVMPETLFTTKRVGPSFTDIPSLEVMLHKLHCEKKKSVELKSVNRSVQFRAGLVARGLKTGRLVPLGNTQTTYGFDSEVIFTGPAFKSTDRENLTGSFPLSTSAPAVVTGGAIANDDGQAALNSETARFEQRCQNVL